MGGAEEDELVEQNLLKTVSGKWDSRVFSGVTFLGVSPLLLVDKGCNDHSVNVRIATTGLFTVIDGRWHTSSVFDSGRMHTWNE